MANAAGQHLPAWAGGQATKHGETQGPRDGEGRTGGRLRNAANLAGAAAAAGATGGRERAPRAARPARRPRARARGRPGGRAANGRGVQRHRRARRRRRPGAGCRTGCSRRASTVASTTSPTSSSRPGFRARTSPVSGAQAREALRSLPDDTRPRRRPARRRPRRRGARAPRLPGPGRVDAGRARGAAHARRGHSRRARRGHPRRARRRRPRRPAGADDRGRRRATRASTSSPAAGPSTPGRSRPTGGRATRRRDTRGARRRSRQIRRNSPDRPPAARAAGAAPREPSASDPDTLFPGGQGGARVNAAPAHLEAKLRFWEFTVGQIAAAFVGMLDRLRVGVVSCARSAGCAAALSGPTSPAARSRPVVRGQPDRVRPVGPVCGAIARWRRLDGRYVPGAGSARARLSCSRATVPTSTRPAIRARFRSRPRGAVGATHDRADAHDRTSRFAETR